MSLKLTIELPLATVAAIQALTDAQDAKTDAAIIDPCAEAIAEAVRQLDFDIKPKTPKAPATAAQNTTEVRSPQQYHTFRSAAYSNDSSDSDNSDGDSEDGMLTPPESEVGAVEEEEKEEEKDKKPVDRKALVKEFQYRRPSHLRMSEEWFTISVKRSPSVTVSVRVQPSMTMGRIKHTVCKEEFSTLRVWYNNEMLKDGKTVTEAGIRPGSTVHIYDRALPPSLPPGSQASQPIEQGQKALQRDDASEKSDGKFEISVKDWIGKIHKLDISERTMVAELRSKMRDLLLNIPACMLRLTCNGVTLLDGHLSVHKHGVRENTELQVSIASACQLGRGCTHVLWK